MPVAEVERALSESDLSNRAKLLIELPEDQWFDRKSVSISPAKLAETLSAMANADGGRIVIGLSDGDVEQMSSQTKNVNELRQAGMEHLDPGLLPHISEVAVKDKNGDKSNLLVIEVAPSIDKVHKRKNGHTFLRVGDENRKLTPEQVIELNYDKGFGSFETTEVLGASIDDLDGSSLASYRRLLNTHRTPLEVLRDRTLSTDESVTVAGVLLFWKNPQRFLPNAVLRVSRFDGTKRLTGRDQNLVNDKMIEAPIPRLVTEAQKVVRQLQPTRKALSSNGLFEEVPTVPEDAWLEGIVNALVHRSYSIQGDHVHVDIFDDRIEIFSPGRFPQVVSLHDPLSIRRYARNPRIVRVCYDLKICQELGEGISRIFSEMAGAGLAEPTYSQDGAGVTLTLSTRPVNEALDRRFPEGIREILSALREHPRMSTAEVIEALAKAGVELSRPAIRSRLNALKDAGQIEWYGKSARDPRAFWYLPDLYSPNRSNPTPYEEERVGGTE